MTDDPFYAPTHRPAPAPERQAGERLFEFRRVADFFRCELRDHGTWGIEVQFYKNGEFMMSQRFDTRVDPTRTPRSLAVEWAVEQRIVIGRGPTFDE